MNIEEFVNDYLQEHRHDVLLNPYNGLVEFAKAFQKKLMDEAVEGEVSHYATVHYVKTNESQLSARLKQFQEGDKVRIIIVKEDGK